MISVEPLRTLIVSDRADDVKRLTVGIREHFQKSRVEAVYTARQAAAWAAEQPWDFILVDLELPDISGLALIRQLRALSPRANIIAHSSNKDVSPMQVMQSGATALLHDKTPAFLDDLLSMTEHLHRRGLGQDPAESTRSRHLQLIEAQGAILYELDVNGAFTYVSPAVRNVLGYDSKELLGTHYSKLLQGESKRLAEQRFNERRAGVRATKGLELRLSPKPRIGVAPRPLEAQVSARGLYAHPDLFLGTVGLIHRDIGGGSSDSLFGQVFHSPSTIPTQARAAKEGSREEIEPLWHALQLFLGNLDFELEPAPGGSPARTPAVSSAAPSGVVPPNPRHTELPTGTYTEQQPVTKAPAGNRRTSTRHAVRLVTEVTIGTQGWPGLTTNLGTGGLGIILSEGSLAPRVTPATISLVSDVLYLQLTGTAHLESLGTHTLLRVIFSGLEDVKRTVLMSFLEVLHDYPDSLRVQIGLVTPDAPATPAPVEQDLSTAVSDRRYDARIPCQMPVQLVCRTPHGILTRFTGTLLDVHLRGARLRTNEGLATQFGTCYMELPTVSATAGAREVSSGTDHISSRHIPLRVIRDVVPAHEGSARAMLGWTYGVQFGTAADETAGHLAALVNHAILSYMGTATYRKDRTVVSELLFTHNAQDRRMALYHDCIGSENPGLTPTIIIAPDLGHTKEQYAELAYFLAHQGFHILRYDLTNHVGESDGAPTQAMLSHLQMDLQAVLSFVSEFWPGTPTILLGHGVAGRICARALRGDWWITGLILLNSPWDLSDELHNLQHAPHDPLRSPDLRQTSGHIFGVQVVVQAFVQDAVTSRYVSFRDLLEDLTGNTIPVAIFTPLENAAHQRDALDRLQAQLGAVCRTMTFIAAPQGGDLSIPARPGNWAHKLAQFCVSESRHGRLAHEVKPVPAEDLVEEQRLESARVQCRRRWNAIDRTRHWTLYVKHNQPIVHSVSYRKWLESVAALLAPLGAQHRLLEFGCGHGDLMAYLLTHHAYHRQQPNASPFNLPEYVGVDLAPEILGHARNHVLGLQASLSREGSSTVFGGRSLTPLFSHCDLNGPMPFPGAQFDALVMNLVFGHVQNPLFMLQECLRVLVPGGKASMLILKPTATLSTWHEQQSLRENLHSTGPSGQHLVEILAEFQEGFLDGALHRFSQPDLRALLTAVRATNITIDSALDGQAYVCTFQKPKSPG